ncbi:MAG: fructosamine kinase family protein, partial [Thiobacillus sp.]|nr:fructosamine kinase family protein [Thiobacillus sp.]
MGLAEAIGQATGIPFAIASRRAVGGGDINRAERLVGRDGRRFFVKLNRADRLAMFEAEADGLAELGAAGAIRV